MNYLLDRKIKRKKYTNIALGVAILIIFILFKGSIFSGLSYVAVKIFHPVLVAGSSIGGKVRSIGAYFSSKSTLKNENQALIRELEQNKLKMSGYNSILKENEDLKSVLGRKNEKTNMILGAILAKPNQSAYDTLLIDIGTKNGIKAGNLVFAEGNVPIGRIAHAYDNASKVVLFSSAGEKTQAIVSLGPPLGGGGAGKDIFMELAGRGGGNFEMVLPKDLVLEKGNQALLPGIIPYVLAETVTIISDPRDPFTKALLRSPVNIQELKFVEVEK